MTQRAALPWWKNWRVMVLLWLVILGLGLLAYATWGWLAAVNRENRYGRLEADTAPPSPGSGPVSDPGPAPDPAAQERSDHP